jgi:hypothetical protein
MKYKIKFWEEGLSNSEVTIEANSQEEAQEKFENCEYDAADVISDQKGYDNGIMSIDLVEDGNATDN